MGKNAATDGALSAASYMTPRSICSGLLTRPTAMQTLITTTLSAPSRIARCLDGTGIRTGDSNRIQACLNSRPTTAREIGSSGSLGAARQQLLTEFEPHEVISRGSRNLPRKLRRGDWRGLLTATERRTAQVFGSVEDPERLAGAIRDFAQGIADRYERPEGQAGRVRVSESPEVSLHRQRSVFKVIVEVVFVFFAHVNFPVSLDQTPLLVGRLPKNVGGGSSFAI